MTKTWPPTETAADPAQVLAAQHGDRQALNAVLTGHLSLVYNVVGSAMVGDPEVDDVVQETMLRAVQALPGLRQPERFRSWLVSIAVHQVQERSRQRARRSTAALGQRVPLDAVAALADPDADVVESTITRMELFDQRNEVRLASTWLRPEDRQVLALWYQESIGELSRAEVAEALAVNTAHAAVRIQRARAQLDLARQLIRAWNAQPRCPALTAAAGPWDRQPAPRWLKRLGRHVRGCAECGGKSTVAATTVRLLTGLAAVPVPVALAAAVHAAVTGAGGIGVGAGTAAASLTAGGGSAGAGGLSGWLSTHLVAPLTQAVGRVNDLIGAKQAIIATATVAAGVTTAAVVGVVATQPPDTASDRAATRASDRAGERAAAPPASLAPSSSAGATPAASADIYVAPDGDDDAAGTFQRPYQTLARAVSAVQPGQTVMLRGGMYRETQPVTIDRDGTAQRRITVVNYPGETPVLDAAGIPADKWYITQTADYWTVRGLEIRNSPGHAYVCSSCQHDVFANLSIHDNGNTGFMLRDPGTTGNQVLDSDFFHNHDTSDHGGSADGLAIKYGTGTGNLVQGCRAYENSADGLDIADFAGPVTVRNTWAYGNGVNRWRIPNFTGPGSGFKLGGGSRVPAANHAITNSAAWDNAGFGFTDGGNQGALAVTNNTAFRNGVTGFALGTAGGTARANLALTNADEAYMGDGVTDAGNSWNQSGWSVIDLRSTDPSTAMGARRPDGSLPETTFLRNQRDSSIGASMTTA